MMASMKYVKALAPGKVNLALRVGASRADGFHPLDTVFEALDIYEELEAWADPSGAITLEYDLAGFGADLPVDESNLAIRAAQALRERFVENGMRTATDKGNAADCSDKSCSAGYSCGEGDISGECISRKDEMGSDSPVSLSAACFGAHMKILKRIPIAGGMAGGSADAAAALVALNSLWELGLDRAELAEIGADLGSDVPFILMGEIARGRSRGEDLVPLSSQCPHGFVMLINPEGLSTPAVFKEYDRLAAKRALLAGDNDTRGRGSSLLRDQAKNAEMAKVSAPNSTAELCAALTKAQEVRDIAPYMGNDLEEPAFSLRPDLREIAQKIRELQRRDTNMGAGVILSGSGPTIAVLCEPHETQSVAAQLQLHFPKLTMLCACGPAQGAGVCSEW